MLQFLQTNGQKIDFSVIKHLFRKLNKKEDAKLSFSELRKGLCPYKIIVKHANPLQFLTPKKEGAPELFTSRLTKNIINDK